MRGEANGTKSNQKSIEPNRSDCYSNCSLIKHNRIGSSSELFGELTYSNSGIRLPNSVELIELNRSELFDFARQKEKKV